MKNSLLLVITVFLIKCSFAQNQPGEIVHVVFEPNTTTLTSGAGPNHWIYIDMDQDGFEEWEFRSWDNGHQAVGFIISPHANAMLDTLGLYTRLRLNLDLQIGDTISNCEDWQLEFAICPVEISEPGSFPHLFMCTRYLMEDGYCYGWIDFSLEFRTPAPTYGWYYADVILHEMAYCTIPNYPFMVGQTDFTWDVSENAASLPTYIHPNPSDGLVTIMGNNLESAEVFNALGQRVATVKGQGEQLTVNLEGLPASIYFVNVTDTEGRRCVKKVVKQ